MVAPPSSIHDLRSSGNHPISPSGIAVYDSAKSKPKAQQIDDNDRSEKPTLLGMKTLSEVQHKLSVMKKNKDAIEARLHFYETKLDQELPQLE